MWDNLLEKLTRAKTKNQTGRIINALFSDYEKKIVVKRLAALALIHAGNGTREIMRALWISPATISALRKNFFGNPNVYKSQRSFKTNKTLRSTAIVMKKSWLEDLFGDINIWELLKNPPRPPGIGLKK